MNQPFLKWADSKAELAPRIVQALTPLFDQSTLQRLIEPFSGSCAVGLNTSVGTALMADANRDLIDTYLWLKQAGAEFIQECEELFANGRGEASYYTYRQHFNEAERGDYERALLFVYLNRHSYNGLCCYNEEGHFDVPYGMYLRPHFPGPTMLTFHRWSQSADFYHADFRSAMDLAQPGDIVYCDPPNLPLTTIDGLIAPFEADFSHEDHRALVVKAEKCAARGIPVVISNVDTPEARTLYATAHVETFPVRRYIRDKSGARAKVWEIVAIFR